MMPNNLPPWYTVYQQAQRWITAGVFENIVHDLRALLRLAKGKQEQPSAAIFDGRTCAGYLAHPPDFLRFLVSTQSARFQ